MADASPAEREKNGASKAAISSLMKCAPGTGTCILLAAELLFHVHDIHYQDDCDRGGRKQTHSVCSLATSTQRICPPSSFSIMNLLKWPLQGRLKRSPRWQLGPSSLCPSDCRAGGSGYPFLWYFLVYSSESRFLCVSESDTFSKKKNFFV